MRPIVIVLLDPARDAAARFVQVAILRRPDFLLLQAAMEPFDVAVSLRMMVRRAPMRYPEPRERFQEPRGSEMRSVVRGQRQVRSSTSFRQPLQHRLFHLCQCVLGSAAVREIPANDLPRAAVDHAHNIRPTHPWPGPDFRHVRLPDLIRPRGFHAAPPFLSPGPQTPRTHQQASLSHHPQHTLAIHRKPFFPPQPPRHAPVTVRELLSAGHYDLLIVDPVGPAAAGLAPVVQARPADPKRRGDRRGPAASPHPPPSLWCKLAAAHSPTTFFRISISSDFRPSVRSSWRIRRAVAGFR